MGASEVSLLVEDLAQPQADERIYEGWMLQSLLHQPPLSLHLLINILSFRPWPGPDADPWEQHGPEPIYHFNNLLGVNQWFFHEMTQQGHGHILNVLSRPEASHGPLQDMFIQTQALLLDVAYRLNRRRPRHRVSISTLCISGQSFLLQGDALPSHVAQDLMPETTSSRDIAGYGYHMVRNRS
jgi:hypothetical protein